MPGKERPMMPVKLSKGFTLVELMVALAILTIGMAGVGTMLVASFQSDRYNARIRRAQVVSLKVFERFKAGNPGVSTSTDPCLTTLPPTGKAAYTNDTCINPDPSNTVGTYYVTWASTAHSGLTQLDVAVYWGGQNCTYADPTKCLHNFAMSSLYQ